MDHAKQKPTGFFRFLVATQGTYFLLTGVWPLLHLDSFIAVTGYKTDVWLVKTVGALLLPMSMTLFYFFFRATDRVPAILLGALSSIAFIAVDFHYATKDTIRDVYMLDGAVEIIILAGWCYVGWQELRKQRGIS